LTVLRTRPRVGFAGRVNGASIAYILACLLPIGTALVIKIYVLPVPYWDEWEWADLIYRLHLGNLHFNDVWSQHNEHRMLFPQLIMLGLAMLGGWNQVREALFSLLLVVVTQVGILVLLRRIVAPQRLPYAFLATSLLLYSLAQMENWDWGFQIAWFLCNACAVWVLVFLGTAGQSWFALSAAALLAVIGSFSSSQGLIIWPAGALALLLTEKRNKPQIGVWIVVAIATFTAYFHDYVRPAEHPDPLFGLHHPIVTLRYFGAYFGAVLAGWIRFAAAVALGWSVLFALAGLVAAAIIEVRSDRRKATRAAGLVGIAAYAVLVAAATTMGRVGFGEVQAEASRYTSVAIYCWIAVIALSVAYADRFREWLPRWLFDLWPAAALVFGLLYVGADWNGLVLGAGRLASVEGAYPALISGYGPQLTLLYPAEARVEQLIKELQSIKDGPYYQ
jgi:hypothetical protein